MVDIAMRRPKRPKDPWSHSLTLVTTSLAIFIAISMTFSVFTRQRDQKGCSMSYMRPAFAHFPDFDAEHTRLAKKYSLYLYREGGIDEDTRVKGIPVLFVPGNAGSYKQVRPLAAQAAVHYHDFIQGNTYLKQHGKRSFDFFSVDFNEDFAAFHGQTLLDQAEYVNDAVSYILGLYHNPHRSIREPDLPHPSAVILIGHSMGGVVARTSFTLQNYEPGSINTIVTLAAPHARPPITFDADIVRTYKHVNDYWRYAFSQPLATKNPLSHVTLVSIAGGGLDAVVPSDYSTLISLVPPTHGFTVFTSTIPEVWAGMDHLAITWCDQLRKAIISALYDVTDALRPTQTQPRIDRIAAFKSRLLTGLERFSDRARLQTESTLTTIRNASMIEVPSEEPLVLENLAYDGEQDAKTYIIPIPASDSLDNATFRLLTNKSLTFQDIFGKLEVLICRIHLSQDLQHSGKSSTSMETVGDPPESTALACKSIAQDAILLPASTSKNKQPFDHYLVNDLNPLVRQSPPFAFVEYDLGILNGYQYVTVRARDSSPGWVIAEISSRSDSQLRIRKGLSGILLNGLNFTLSNKTLLSEVHIPRIRSSLLAYKLRITELAAKETNEIFTPLLRQHISNPFESKFFVNVKEVDINIHGDAPYTPSTADALGDVPGLSFQIWVDPSHNSPKVVTLKVDILGSIGMLWMRYRTLFVTFPLIIMALVFQRQLSLYNASGCYINFSESIGLCLKGTIPVFFFGLTIVYVSLSQTAYPIGDLAPVFRPKNSFEGIATSVPVDDLLLGSRDPFFWFLIPIFGIISVGVCVTLNCTVLATISAFALAHSYICGVCFENSDKSSTGFIDLPVRRRIVTTAILLLLVATAIPYQFVFIVLCLVQIRTCIRARIHARENVSAPYVIYYGFYNYVHSVLLLMLLVLPINVPTLVVWIHNLAVHWFAPFSSHHNILSIMPFTLLVESLSTGNIVPQVRSPLSFITSGLLFFLAVYTALYGVTFAYLIHSIMNSIFAWLALLHISTGRLNFKNVPRLAIHSSSKRSKSKVKKEP